MLAQDDGLYECMQVIILLLFGTTDTESLY